MFSPRALSRISRNDCWVFDQRTFVSSSVFNSLYIYHRQERSRPDGIPNPHGESAPTVTRGGRVARAQASNAQGPHLESQPSQTDELSHVSITPYVSICLMLVFVWR